MSKCIKRTIHWLSVLSFCAVVIVQPLFAGNLPNGKVFQNQLISLSDDTAAVVLHAQQMGYDYINGQPWSATRAREGAAVDLGVLFNTGADSAKWMRINSAMTTINGRPITAQDLVNFTKVFCMKDPTATVLTDRFIRDTQYPGETILFHPNYFSSEAVDILLAYNIELFESHGGAATHAGVYVDQINAGTGSPHPGPCLNPVRRDFATAADGQLEYLKRLQHYFRNQLGLPMSGNPYRMTHYQSRHITLPFDLYYNENGSLTTNHVSDFGVIPPERVGVSLPANDQFNNNYQQALRTAGTAMQQGSWFGWFARANPSQTGNGVQLLRALPNWDNLVDATARSWNPNTLEYQTSNSYADPNVVYGRHPETGKLFVVFQNKQGVLLLQPGEVVTDVKRVDRLFVEAADGFADLAITNSRVTLANTQNMGKGYILTTIMKPNSPPTADAGRAQTVITGTVVQLDGTGSKDADGDPLTYSWHMTTVPSGSNAILSTPKAVKSSFAPNKVGQYVVHLQVNDGKDTSAPAVVTITAIQPNSPPVAHSQTLSTLSAKAVRALLRGSDPDGDPLTFRIITPPVNGTLSGVPPEVTYTPKPGFSGKDHIVFCTNDRQAESAAAIISVQVTPTPTLPFTPKNLVLNPSFEGSLAFSSWIVPKTSTRANSTLSIGSAPHETISAQVNIKQAGPATDVELQQVVPLLPKGVYRLRFWAKASSNRPFTTLLMQDKKPWGTVGLWKRVSLSSHWQQFDIVFTHTGVEPEARLVFRMGDQSGTVWIDNVELIAQP